MSMPTIPCTLWIDLGAAHFGGCGAGLYGARPSHGVCRECPSRIGPAADQADWPCPPDDAAAAAPPPSQSNLPPLAGDQLAALLARIGAERLAKWWERKTGIPCGCTERRDRLNRAHAALKRLLAREGSTRV